METSKKTILVVEDDNDARQAMELILTSLGYHAITFSGGQEALQGLVNQTCDLALLDIMMPEMSGYELLQELRKQDRFKELPVIMVTAKDADSEVLDGYKYGADYYITKPFTRAQLEYGIKFYLS